MAVIRNRTQQQYTNVANSIFRNKELSLRDRGLLTTLLSLPDNWRFSVMGLAEILKKDGKHSISAGLASLEEQGYLVRRQVKSKDGKFCGYKWEIFEEPQMKVPITDFRETDNPITEKLSAENQPQSNTNKVITKELNTNRSSEEETYRNKWQYQSAVKQTSGKVAEGTYYEIGKYGRMRREYLKNHRRREYIKLLKDGRLNEYLHEDDTQCYEREELLVEQMKVRVGITEELKNADQMKWVGLMNNMKSSAEEIVLKELVYV